MEVQRRNAICLSDVWENRSPFLKCLAMHFMIATLLICIQDILCIFLRHFYVPLSEANKSCFLYIYHIFH